jgi:hypothetical protein
VSYTAADAVQIAKSQVGYRESGTNLTKFNQWLGTIPGYPHGGYGYPWCQSFQSWVASKAGGRANIDYPKTAGCEVAVAWFKSHKRWAGRTSHVGDMVFYGPGGGTHVELVVAVTSSTITTVGGNTSGSLNGTYHNGNGVYRKTVSRGSSRIYGYGRPVYATATQEEDMPLNDADKKWIRGAIREEVHEAVYEADVLPAPGSNPDDPFDPANNPGFDPAQNTTWAGKSYPKQTVQGLIVIDGKLDKLTEGAGVVDVDALAAALAPLVAPLVADELAQRLES